MRHNIRNCRAGARVDCCPCPPNKKCSTSPASPSSPAQPYTHRVNLWRFIVAGIQLLLLLLLLHTNFIFYTNREEFSYFVIDFCLLTLSLAIFELLAFRAKCFLFCLFCFCFFDFFFVFHWHRKQFFDGCATRCGICIQRQFMQIALSAKHCILN